MLLASRVYSAAQANLDFKPQGMANLLSGLEVPLNGAPICNFICWTNRKRGAMRPNLHRKRLQVSRKVLGRDVYILGLRTHKWMLSPRSRSRWPGVRIEACISKTVL